MPLSDTVIRRLIKIAGLVAFTIIAIYFSLYFLDIIIILVISILVALIFHPLVTFFEKNGLNRLSSVLLVFLIGALILFIGFSVVIPKIASQMNTLASTLNRETIVEFIQAIEAEVKAYVPFLESQDFATQIAGYISNLVFESIDNVSNIISSIASVLAIVVIVPFITFFLLKDKSKIIKGIIDIMPNRYFEMSYSVIRKISNRLGRFVIAWILDAFLVGLLSAIGLTILGIENSVSIGFVAGIGHLIPYFGPIIGGLPALIISLIQFGDFSMLPEISLMFVIIYTLDNGFIQPNVFSKGTDLHPLAIIILILIGSKIMGVMGMLLAVPTATVVKTASREIYHGYKNYRIIKT